MKTVLSSLLLLLVSSVWCFAIEENAKKITLNHTVHKTRSVVSLPEASGLSDSTSSQPPRAVSNHTVSLQVLGLEYGYEQRLGGSFSMVFRAGLVPAGVLYYSDYINTAASFAMKLGAGVEPRCYTNFGRRARLGKSTFRNSADFVSVKIQCALGGVFGIYDDSGTPGLSSPVDVSLTPMYGIRRVWGRNWFDEFSAGARIGWQSMFYAAPYLQCRIGLVF